MLLKSKFLCWVIWLTASLHCVTAVAQNSPEEMTDQHALAYIASYPDLIAVYGTNTAAAKMHYFGSGKAEGRTINFQPLQYVASYPDLITVFGLDAETATRQYIRSGRAQGRLPTFNGLEYIASNIAFLRYLGVDVNEAARHYITTGYAAGWKTKSFSVLDYIASYADLISAFGRNVMQAAAHFITSGYAENRSITFNPTQYLANYSDLRSSFGTNTSAATTHFISNGYNEGRTSTKPNAAPSAVIAPVQSIYLINSTITLNGGASFDPEGGTLGYAWSLISKPQGSVATIGSPTNSTAGLAPDVGGSYVVQLTVSDGQATSAVTMQIQAGTPVSGNITSSTIWTKAMSPIIQVGRLGILQGVSLTMTEGVEFFGGGYVLQVDGTLKVEGTATGKVRLSNVDIQGLGTTSANHLILIKHAIVDGDLYRATGLATYGNLVLEDSRLTLNNYIHVWLPRGNVSIQRNYFVKGRISFSTGAGSITIKNNSFPGGGQGGGAYYGDSIYSWSVDQGIVVDVSLNTFRSTNGVAVSVGDSGAIDARNNYWSTTDPAIIEQMIWDKNDNLRAPGYINYTPFLIAPDPATPTQ